MSKIDVKYRIPLKGEYWKGINSCPECFYRPSEGITDDIIGFAQSNGMYFTVCECPKCGTHWYFHARDLEKGDYYYFRKAIAEKTQKHYKGTEKKEDFPQPHKLISPKRK